MLCANKIDLRDDAIAEGRSVVRVEDGTRLAKVDFILSFKAFNFNNDG